MELLEPGPNFSDHDPWDVHPLGEDAPKHRLGADPKLISISGQD
jgi:hypothetical protein